MPALIDGRTMLYDIRSSTPQRTQMSQLGDTFQIILDIFRQAQRSLRKMTHILRQAVTGIQRFLHSFPEKWKDVQHNCNDDALRGITSCVIVG